MIDISHSMILYGEDRITPAKKVAMALSELITTRYPKDSLDILVFGNDAKVISIKKLPYLKASNSTRSNLRELVFFRDGLNVLDNKLSAKNFIFLYFF